MSVNLAAVLLPLLSIASPSVNCCSLLNLLDGAYAGDLLCLRVDSIGLDYAPLLITSLEPFSRETGPSKPLVGSDAVVSAPTTGVETTSHSVDATTLSDANVTSTVDEAGHRSPLLARCSSRR